MIERPTMIERARSRHWHDSQNIAYNQKKPLNDLRRAQVRRQHRIIRHSISLVPPARIFSSGPVQPCDQYWHAGLCQSQKADVGEAVKIWSISVKTRSPDVNQVIGAANMARAIAPQCMQARVRSKLSALAGLNEAAPQPDRYRS